MGTLPNIKVTQTNGNLGRVAAADDSIAAIIVTGIAVAGQFALGDVIGPVKSLDEVKAKGINPAYDTANNVLAYQQISDFFKGAGEGSELYIMVVAATVTMTDLCDKTMNYAAKILQTAAGRVRLLAICRIPNTVGTITDQFEADLIAAVTKAQDLYVSEFAEPRYRPVQILLEGRNFQGSASTAKDFRTMAANRVSIVIAQDADIAAKNAAYAKYACVGYALGILAAQPVQRNIGRVKNGTLVLGKPALSSGALLSTISDTDQETLNAKGMIFIKRHVGADGLFFNDDHTCTLITDDYAFVTTGRIMDKASRITRSVYVTELLDEVEVDSATGRLAVATAKQYQGLVETAINNQMTANQEISGVAAFVDPLQNVTSTDKIIIRVAVRKKGTARFIDAYLGYAPTI